MARPSRSTINARGVLFTVQKALPLIRDGAAIVMTSTIAALRDSGRSAYSASKTALRSCARTWTMELKDRGIRVKQHYSWPTDTPIIDAEALPEKRPMPSAPNMRRIFRLAACLDVRPLAGTTSIGGSPSHYREGGTRRRRS
jgi:NAD(P)-dependent dehydrogenase (short-subunit alcohol dehydrogenase family)